LCLFLIQSSARFGFSRLLSKYALIANSVPAADQAVRLGPSDPEAHRTRATVLNRLQMTAEAAKSLESATGLRYRDDYLWIELGNLREELGDSEGALAAFDQAVKWAPYYAHTHWLRGNLLLRMGRSAEGFAELRAAANANGRYRSSLIDLAWGISHEDVKATTELVEIHNDAERLSLIRFLARKGKGRETLDQVRLLATPLSAENRNDLVRLLFASKAFREAFDLWAAETKIPVPSLLNGGFEDPLILNDSGFGWIVSPDQSKNKQAIDISEKFGGTKSLQINLDGNWIPGTTLLSQTVIVGPDKTYRLSFAVKTKDLMTGGPPVITVSDAGNNELLGKSENFPTATSPWVKLNFEFKTLATSQAAVIRLQRNNCEPSPCPIYGVLWLDEIHID
jgi:tetratricopeptide (TPR) repeat protein